jgi:hypothetical protein
MILRNGLEFGLYCSLIFVHRNTHVSQLGRNIERGNLQRNDYVHERSRLAVRQVLETAMAVSPLPPLDFHSGSSGLQDFSPGPAGSPNQLLSTSLSPHPLGQSPMGLFRGYRIQDTASQTWTPRS